MLTLTSLVERGTLTVEISEAVKRLGQRHAAHALVYAPLTALYKPYRQATGPITPLSFFRDSGCPLDPRVTLETQGTAGELRQCSLYVHKNAQDTDLRGVSTSRVCE